MFQKLFEFDLLVLNFLSEGVEESSLEGEEGGMQLLLFDTFDEMLYDNDGFFFVLLHLY